jgi:hypothetical protein
LGFLKPKITKDNDSEDYTESEITKFKPKEDSKEIFIEIDELSNKIKNEKEDMSKRNKVDSNSVRNEKQDPNKQINYKEILFNYKNYIPETNNTLKRRNNNPIPECLDVMINKKQEWIKKEKNSKDRDNKSTNVNEGLSNESSCIVAINDENSKHEIVSSKALSLESNLNSKVKFENNFIKKVDYSSFNNIIKPKVDQSEKHPYDFGLKTFEDQDDSSFFESKNPFIPKKEEPAKKRNTMAVISPKMVNYRKKKDREKLQGYRCEICQNVNTNLFSFMKY